MPEDRAEVALEAFKRLKSGSTVNEVTAWLSLTAVKRRRALETAAQAWLDVENERKQGALASAAARRGPWQAWREWICREANVPSPEKAHLNFKRTIIEVIRFRKGVTLQEPPGNARVPKDLPALRGQDGKWPSEDTIRRNLFGSRAK